MHWRDTAEAQRQIKIIKDYITSLLAARGMSLNELVGHKYRDTAEDAVYYEFTVTAADTENVYVTATTFDYWDNVYMQDVVFSCDILIAMITQNKRLEHICCKNWRYDDNGNEHKSMYHKLEYMLAKQQAL